MPTATQQPPSTALGTPLPEYLTTPRILAIVPISLSTFDRMVKSGGFPPPTMRLGRRKLWARETVLAWLAEQSARAQ